MQKLKTFLSGHLLLSPLILILTVITVQSLHPDFYFMGWDNFSVDINLPVNISRVLFDSWRDYRGLGVASDSEIVDVFRQLFFLILSPFVPSMMFGQIYLIFSLWAGVLLMYVFAYQLYKYTFNLADREHVNSGNLLGSFIRHMSSSKAADLFGFLACFFYLFNLNTLAVFYFPMLPYTSRFFAIPALHLVLFELVKNRTQTLKKVSKYIFLILLASISYITATIFVTMTFSLILHGVSYLNPKRLIIFFMLFIGLNLFWILPFITYTFDKAYDIQLSPANIEGNEVLLNKYPEFYSLSKQLIFYSTFFDLNYTDPQTNTPAPFYPLTQNFNKIGMKILYVFPFLYLMGSLVVFLLVVLALKHKYKREFNHLTSLIWIPTSIAFFMFLSLQNYGPTGPIYQFISDKIPLFTVVFRFGDAKFHPFVVFAGALASAFFIITILFFFLQYILIKFKNFIHFGSSLSHKNLLTLSRVIIVFIVLIPIIFSFRTYFNGNFVGYFMYNKIPSAYFEIAKIINSDPEEVRVLHLPIDETGYWQPYSWGYFGSSFFHFLINKPLFDRTFEPASKENIIFDNTIYSLMQLIPSITNQPDQDIQTDRLYRILQDASVKYVIWDQTIDINIPSRGQQYWGVLSTDNARVSLEKLKAKGYLREAGRYRVNPLQSPLLTGNQERTSPLPSNVSGSQDIVLYEVTDTFSRIQFVGKGQNVDANLGYLTQTSFYPSAEGVTFTQPKPGTNSLIFPFARRDVKVTDMQGAVAYNLTQDVNTQSGFLVKTSPTVKNGSRLIKLVGSQVPDGYEITLSEVMAPSVQNYDFDQVIGSVVLNQKQLSQLSSGGLRLEVDSQIIAIPAVVDIKGQTLGYVLIHQNPFLMDLLQARPVMPVSTALLEPTSISDCQSTQLAGYKFDSKSSDTGTEISAINGSGCLITNLGSFSNTSLPYAELSVDISLRGSNNEQISSLNLSSTRNFPSLIASIPKPNVAYFCVKEEGTAPCTNPYQFFSFSGDKRVILPIYNSPATNKNLIFALHNISYQKLQATIRQLNIEPFESINSYKITLPPEETYQKEVTLDRSNLTFILPKTLSSTSSYNNLDQFNLSLSDAPCQDTQGFSTTRAEFDMFLLFTKKCGNGLFYTNHVLGNDMYLWIVNYNLISGQYPFMKIYDADNKNTYFNQRASEDQGYPNVPFFKQLDMINQPLQENSLQNLQMATASVLVSPSLITNNQKNKIFGFSQYTENNGAMAVKYDNIIAFPPRFGSLTLEPVGNNISSYQIPQSYAVRRLFPFLWKVTTKGDTQLGAKMMLFSEGYDSHWNVYSSLGNLMLGSIFPSEHTRCNGLYNCYIFTDQKPAGEQVFYLFYDIEKLSFLGIGSTLFFVICILILRNKLLQ